MTMNMFIRKLFILLGFATLVLTVIPGLVMSTELKVSRVLTGEDCEDFLKKFQYEDAHTKKFRAELHMFAMGTPQDESAREKQELIKDVFQELMSVEELDKRKLGSNRSLGLRISGNAGRPRSGSTLVIFNCVDGQSLKRRDGVSSVLKVAKILKRKADQVSGVSNNLRDWTEKAQYLLDKNTGELPPKEFLSEFTHTLDMLRDFFKQGKEVEPEDERLAQEIINQMDQLINADVTN